MTMARFPRLRRFLLALGFAVVATVLVLLGAAQSRKARIAVLHHDAAPMIVNAPQFAQAEIPAEFSCKGAGHPPAIAWSGAPARTASYLVMIRDDDVPHPNFPIASFTHWMLFNIPPDVRALQTNATNPDLFGRHIDIGLNSAGTLGYFAPCPPLGRHRYVISVFALDAALIKPKKNDADSILDAIKGHVVGYGSALGTLS